MDVMRSRRFWQSRFSNCIFHDSTVSFFGVMRLFFFLFPVLAFAWATDETFLPRRTQVFVETGSYFGGGIEKAIGVGYEEIHSIELSDSYFHLCQNRFSAYSYVHLWHGDSGVMLADVIAGIQEPITFWLDAHYSGNDTAKGSVNCPILRELEIIKNHPIKSHQIFIDDIRLFGTEEFDSIYITEVIQKLLEINPRYKITFKTGFAFNDILVAQE
jgi:hypothetical protein